MSELVGLIARGKEPIQVPLDSVSIQANIYGILAHYEASFSYTNATTDPIEVEFKHPLHSEAVLTGIEAVIDGKTIKGIVKEKGEAKTEYEDAIASGNTAVLVEEESRDIIGILLGNLSPGKNAIVRLQLLQQLDVEQQGIHLLLPATLKPRYELTSDASSEQQQGAIRMHPSALSPDGAVLAIYKFSFELFLVGEIGKLKQITSPSHTLGEFTATDGRKGMQVTSPDPLNSDLVVYIDFDTIDPLSALIEPALPERTDNPAQHPYIDNPAVLLTFMPKSQGTDSIGCSEFVFVIDQSGSMSGGPIREARETLDMLLRSISPGCYFNIIGFGSDYVSLFPGGSVEYSQDSLDRAVKHVSDLQANLGGTEILRPLQHVFSRKPVSGLARQVFLLTDGGVSNIEAVVQIVANNSSHTRVFTFGIGSGVSTALVNRVAKAGKGKAVFISSKERMQARVMEVMNTAMSPSYTEIAVTGSKSMVIYPQAIPVLFENEPFVVVGFFNENIIKGEKISATLKYSSLAGAKATTINFSLADSISSHFPHLPRQLVHQFGVSKTLRDLEESVSSKDECIILSCYANIMCKHTSFVAVGEDKHQVIQGAMKVYNVIMNTLDCDSPISSMCSGGSRQFPMSASALPPMRGSVPPPMRGSALPPMMGSALPRMGSALPPMVWSALSAPPPPMMHFGSAATRNFDTEFTCESDSASNDLFDDLQNLQDFSGFTYDSAPAPKLQTAAYRRSEPAVHFHSSLPGHQGIMKLQKAEGYWEYSAELETLLGCKKSKESCPGEVTNVTVWMTVLSLCCLEHKFQQFKSEWLLVFKKGERWVQAKSGDSKLSYEQIRVFAVEFFKK